MEFLEANGLEDAVLVILPGEAKAGLTVGDLQREEQGGCGCSPTGSLPPSAGCSGGGSPAAPPAALQPPCHPPSSPAVHPELQEESRTC